MHILPNSTNHKRKILNSRYTYISSDKYEKTCTPSDRPIKQEKEIDSKSDGPAKYSFRRKNREN